MTTSTENTENTEPDLQAHFDATIGHDRRTGPR